MFCLFYIFRKLVKRSLISTSKNYERNILIALCITDSPDYKPVKPSITLTMIKLKCRALEKKFEPYLGNFLFYIQTCNVKFQTKSSQK